MKIKFIGKGKRNNNLFGITFKMKMSECLHIERNNAFFKCYKSFGRLNFQSKEKIITTRDLMKDFITLH